MDASLVRKLAPVLAAVGLSVAGWFVGREMAGSGMVNIAAQNPGPALVETVREDAAQPNHEGRGTGSAPLKPALWQDAISQCIAEPSQMRRLQRFYEITQRIDTRDFPALMEVLRAEKNDLGLRGELFEVWAERDLRSARAWFDAQPAEEHSWLGPRLVAVWGRMDVAGLASWISTLPAEGRKKLVPLRELIGAIAERDPEGTLDLLAKIPEVDPYSNQIAIAALLQRDPATAAARILAMPTGEAKDSAFATLAFGWVKKDLNAALEWFEQLDDSERAEWAREVAAFDSAGRSEADFVKALEMVAPEKRFVVLERRASKLAQTSPEDAFDFARQTEPDMREAVMVATLREISSTDPARAVELWLAETTQGGRAGNAGALVAALAKKQGVSAALRFLDRIPSETGAALKDLPNSLAEIAGWAAVADAAAKMPAGTRRSEWLQESVSALTRDGELAAAQQLAARLPTGPDRENAVQAMGAALITENPDLAATTLLRLSDGSKALADEVQRWIKADAPEARRWISSTALLSEAMKAELLASAAPPR